MNTKELLIRQAFNLYERLSDRFQDKSINCDHRARYLKASQIALKRYQRRKGGVK